MYINEGHDVTNAEDMKTALLSHGGVTGVRVAVLAVVEGQEIAQQQQKFPGISKLNNFQSRDGHLLAWRAYGIGVGKRVVDKITGDVTIISSLCQKKKNKCNIVTSIYSNAKYSKVYYISFERTQDVFSGKK